MGDFFSMDKFYINSKDIKDVLTNSNIHSEYFNVYKNSFAKTKQTFEDIKVDGYLIAAKELFIVDSFIVQSIIEEAASLKRNIVAFNENSTLFIYLAEESLAIKEKLAKQDFLFNDLIEFLSADFNFEKVKLEEDIAYPLASVRELCL